VKASAERGTWPWETSPTKPRRSPLVPLPVIRRPLLAPFAVRLTSAA